MLTCVNNEGKMGKDLVKELERQHEKELEKMGVRLSSGISLSGMLKERM